MAVGQILQAAKTPQAGPEYDRLERGRTAANEVRRSSCVDTDTDTGHTVKVQERLGKGRDCRDCRGARVMVRDHDDHHEQARQRGQSHAHK